MTTPTILDPNVELFTIPELPAACPDDAESRLALINALGLSGQKTLIEGGRPTLRFRLILPVEMTVFSFLFPRAVPLSDYAEESVPLSVLTVADDALRQGLHRVTVWCPEKAGIPDLVLVAYKDSRRYYDSECYLLARWGFPLASSSDLIDLWKEKAHANVASMRTQADLLLSKIKEGPHSFTSPPTLTSLHP